jgi:hypothetical protein
MGVTCNICNVHYCGKCAFDINAEYRCYFCKGRMEAHVHEDDPGDIGNSHTINTRSVPRDEYTTTIEYIIAHKIKKDRPGIRIKAVTKDVSKKGICIYTEQAHHPGQKITFFECDGLHIPLDAQVVWSKKVSDSIYRVGLEFIGKAV